MAQSANAFYRDHYHHMLVGLIVLVVLCMASLGVVCVQVYHRPLPVFYAVSGKQQMLLVPSVEPNLLPGTILRWASQAAIASYTMSFSNYQQQIAAAQPYFTPSGWADYTASVKSVTDTIVKNQLIASSVVADTPVISNQGNVPSQGYSWRVQIPFLVTYESAGLQGNVVTQHRYYVLLTIVRVPTTQNPQGIGIAQFVMVNR